MSVDLGIWSRLTKLAVSLVVLAVLLLIGMCYLPVIKQNEQYRRQLLIDQEKIAKEEARARELQAQLDAVLHDPKTVERMSRNDAEPRPHASEERWHSTHSRARLRTVWTW